MHIRRHYIASRSVERKPVTDYRGGDRGTAYERSVIRSEEVTGIALAAPPSDDPRWSGSASAIIGHSWARGTEPTSARLGAVARVPVRAARTIGYGRMRRKTGRWVAAIRCTEVAVIDDGTRLDHAGLARVADLMRCARSLLPTAVGAVEVSEILVSVAASTGFSDRQLHERHARANGYPCFVRCPSGQRDLGVADRCVAGTKK